MLHGKAASTHSRIFLWNRWAWNRVCPSWLLWQNFWRGKCKASLFIPCTVSVSFSSAPLCCLPRGFFLIFIFISLFIILLFKSSVSHGCYDNSFYRLLDAFLKPCYLWFVLSGILLLVHVFLSYPPECFYSTQKSFGLVFLSLMWFYFLPSSSMPD